MTDVEKENVNTTVTSMDAETEKEEKPVESDEKNIEANDGEEDAEEHPSAPVESEKPQKAAKDEDVVPTRPVKRARTAYFIFADAKRQEVRKEVSILGPDTL
jgi:hypothetical protein